MSLKERIFKNSPLFFQNILISVFNFLAYKKRYGGNYKMYRDQYRKYSSASLEDLEKKQRENLKRFSIFVLQKSNFYKNLYGPSITSINLENIENFPIISKQDLQKHYKNIRTISKKNGILSKTGGTTGKSIEVVFTKENMQERFAILDSFRSEYGYELGKKTAWFSGKNIVFEKDVKQKRFWKTDYLYNIRYYSTFHIKSIHLKYYIENLKSFKPEYIAGFPSVMLEIAQYGINNDIVFPSGIVKAIFPTAETINLKKRKILEIFFKAKVYDQYASSEGAPFIFECNHQKLHMQLQTGVFEILDEDYKPAKEGKLVVTSFTTRGTPLIRYDIGDTVIMSDAICDCGNNNPILDRITGREVDFVFSPENGKINLGNISNILKGIDGVKKFQAHQNKLNEIDIKLVVDHQLFSKNEENSFIKKWEDYLGSNMIVTIEYVSEIPNESNGKFRIVKNNIKHLL